MNAAQCFSSGGSGFWHTTFCAAFGAIVLEGFFGYFRDAGKGANNGRRFNWKHQKLLVWRSGYIFQSVNIFGGNKVVDGLNITLGDCVRYHGCGLAFSFSLTFSCFRVTECCFLTAFRLQDGGLFFTFCA